MNETLTFDEIEMLLEALDSWEKESGTTDLMIDVLVGGLARTPEDKQEWEAKREASKVERDSAKKLRAERAIMMKAKLLHMRDAVEAGSMASAATAKE